MVAYKTSCSPLISVYGEEQEWIAFIKHNLLLELVSTGEKKNPRSYTSYVLHVSV